MEKLILKKEQLRGSLLAEMMGPEFKSRLMDVVKRNNAEEMKKFSTEYIEKYPESAELMEVFSGLPGFLEIHEKMKTAKIFGAKISKEAFKDQTEYQFLLNHFLINNPIDKKFLNEFWNVLDKIARNKGNFGDFNAIRTGVLS